MGYETHNSLINMTFVCLIIFLFYFKVIIAGILRLWVYIFNDRYGGKKLFDILTKNMFFEEVFGLSLESYLEFLINGYLTFK